MRAAPAVRQWSAGLDGDCRGATKTESEERARVRVCKISRVEECVECVEFVCARARVCRPFLMKAPSSKSKKGPVFIYRRTI